MKNNLLTKKVLVPASAILLITLIILGYYLFFKAADNQSQPITQKNKENAAKIKSEKDKDSVVITDSSSLDSQKNDDSSSQDAEATVDNSGASTNLERKEVKPAVTAVLSLYQDFLSKLKAVPEDQRQSLADKYYDDHADMFNPSFGYAGGYSLHLLPQSSNIALPGNISANSAITDPSEPSQTIVQIFMPPDTSWSLLVVVKMNNDDTLGTIERLMIRQNLNPL